MERKDGAMEEKILHQHSPNNREQILGNIIQAYRYVNDQEGRDKPLELLEDALKKLKHDNLKIENMGTEYYEKALILTESIITEAGSIHKAVDDARYQFKKLSKNKKA